MQPIFAAARQVAPERSRIVYAEGEDERVLRAVQIVVDEKIAVPILVGRPAVIERAVKRHGLRLRIGDNVTIVNQDGTVLVPSPATTGPDGQQTADALKMTADQLVAKQRYETNLQENIQGLLDASIGDHPLQRWR